jgi:hypothetical protein
MTDYELHVSSYGGLVFGAHHFYGRVNGPNPEPCHGNRLRYNAPESRGKCTCDEGHVIPARVEWTVEAGWTEDRYNRYSAEHFEGDGPDAFRDEMELLATAVKRFRGEIPHHWWEGKPTVGRPGDRLYYGHVADPGAGMTQPDRSPLPPWGSVLAEIPPDDRPCPEGRSNPARLARWVRDNVPNTRIREDGEAEVAMTGGEIYDLLLDAVDRFYHHGADDALGRGV